MPFEFTRRKKKEEIKMPCEEKTEKAMAALHIKFFYTCKKVLYK